MAKTFDELARRTTTAATRRRAAKRTRELLAASTGRLFVGTCRRCGAGYVAADLLGTRQTACPGCRTGEIAWNDAETLVRIDGHQPQPPPAEAPRNMAGAPADLTDAALGEVHDMVDALLYAGEWPAVEAILSWCSRRSCTRTIQGWLTAPTDKLLALLTATAPAKSRLPGRAAFLAEVRSALGARGEDEARLLGGLE